MNKHQNIFDNQVFFDGYRKLRFDKHNANNFEEKPALFSLCPELNGKTVLDLGCGFGENCAKFKKLGALDVIGVDISEKMLEVAMNDHPDCKFIHADMRDLSFLNINFDIVFSSLAVHYIDDFSAFVKNVYSAINAGGYFVFSQEHPLTTAPLKGNAWTKNENGEVLHYNLSDYLRNGKRIRNWFVDDVEKYHRTFSEIINTLCLSGFIIERMLEPAPSDEAIAYDIKYEKHYHRPNFLLIKAKKL